MKFLPIGINIAGKHILIIGGGAVAAQKLRTLKKFTSLITIVAPRIDKSIKESVFLCKEKTYEPSDLRGAGLVYACTNNRKLNARVKKDANRRGILVNTADDASLCDFISPAVYKKGSMTIAVSSDGTNAKKSAALRDRIKKYLKK